MLQGIKVWGLRSYRWFIGILQGIKVWILRKYYRFISARGWQAETGKIHRAGVEIPGDDGPIHGRMFTGGGSPDRPIIVYFHGGGWVIGDLDTHTPFCELLCEHTGCTVISVDYRLAPEHPFPAAPRDCLSATRWIAEHIGDFGPSNHRLVIAGDSAGGNLAAATCLEIEQADRELIVGQLLLYPAVDHYSAGFPSYVEHATGQVLTAKLMFFFWDTYLATANVEAVDTSLAFPLRSPRLDSLPATLLVTAELDPLCDEGRAFGDRLRESGVPLHYRHFDNSAHGFACSQGFNPELASLLDDISAWVEDLG